MANITIEPMSVATAIVQKATANFDGTLPTTELALRADGMYRFPDDTEGGFFRWDGAKEPLILHAFYATLTVSGNATLTLVNLDAAGAPIAGEEWEVAAITGATRLLLSAFDLSILTSQAFKLVTTQPGIAIGYASIERMHRH
jgi:hypothetical protein